MIANGRKLLISTLALLLVFGVSTSWAAFTETTNSGAADVKVYIDTNSVGLGGDSVNIAINILNATGGVNTISNGQVGDVLIEVTTQLGNTIWIDTAPAALNGLINAADGGTVAVPVPGGSGANISGFVADVDQYIQPANGRATGSVAYNTTSGTDTLVVNVYQALAAGGGGNPAAVIPGTLLGSWTADVTVGSGSTVVTALNSVFAGNGAGNLVLGNVADANVGGAAVRQVYGIPILAAGNNVYSVDAGQSFAMHLRGPQSQNGPVKVGFYKVGGIQYNGGAAPAIRSTTSKPSMAAEIDMTVADGVADTTTSLTEAGYYMVVASVDYDAGNALELPMTDAANGTGNLVLIRVLPVGATADNPVVSSISLGADRSAVSGDAANGSAQQPLRLTTRLLDAYGNRTYSKGDTPVSYSGAIVDATGATIAARNSGQTSATVTRPTSLAPLTIKSTAAGFTSDPVIISVYGGKEIVAGGAGSDDSCVGAQVWVRNTDANGTTEVTAGGKVRVYVENDGVCTQWAADGVQMFLTVANSGETAAATFDATKLAGTDVSNNNDPASPEDFYVDFVVTKATTASAAYFGVTGGVPQGVNIPAPVLIPNAAAVGSSAYDSTAGALSSWGGLTVNPTGLSTHTLLGLRGTELTTYSAGNGTDNVFGISGYRVQALDQYSNNIGPAANGQQLATVVSANFPGTLSVDDAASDGSDLAPQGAAQTTNALDVNYGLTLADPGGAGSDEVAWFDYAATDSGTDALTFYSSATTTPVSVDILNIGNPYTQIKVSSNSGVTDEIVMPQNGTIPIIVETLNDSGSRMPSDNDELLLNIGSTLINCQITDGQGAGAANWANIASGFEFDTRNDADVGTLGAAYLGQGRNGRQVFMLNAGASTGETTFKVTQKGGTIESNTLTVKVEAIAPDQPVQGDEIVAGSGTTDPADVTVTTDDTVDLFVFTDIDGFTPTACWVTLNIDGTNFYWVYDEANSAWVRFNFVAADHADFDASFPTLAEAITDYPFTATGADQQVGNDLPMTGLSGLVFKVTVWYFDADGALQSFDYLITVS